MIKLSPSILAADFTRLGEQIMQVEQAQAQYLHFDVMDGSFVPSISFGLPVLQSVRRICKMSLDVHLMIDEPYRYINEFVAAGADILTVHAEACIHLHRTVAAVKEAGVKVGVALNPATPLCVLDYILPELDLVLLMSVNPGFGGQKFLPITLQRIKDLRMMFQKANCHPELEVDGGIRHDNALTCIQAGADVLVAGTSVFQGNISDNIAQYKEVFKRAAQ